MQGRPIVTIDPEGENDNLCQAVGGKVIPARMPADPDTCLFHPLQGEDPAEMLRAVRFLVATLSGQNAMTPGMQAVLHEAVQRRWARRPGPMSITDLIETLSLLSMPAANDAVYILKQYAQDGVWGGFFDRPKALLSPNIEPGEWWNFDLKELTTETSHIVHAMLSWFLYHAVTVGRIPMDIYIDEAWLLLRGGPFLDMLDELGRRARKRGIGVTLITHLPKDLERGATSLSLASNAFIGYLPPDEAFSFFRSVGVSESEAAANAEIVSNLKDHTFVVAPSGGRGSLFGVDVAIPPSWLTFWEKYGATR
jgi:type IV secretory pathway VirB4 component